jgi:hypothetical protein
MMAADLDRKRKGKKTRTGMTAKQLHDFSRKRKATPPSSAY